MLADKNTSKQPASQSEGSSIDGSEALPQTVAIFGAGIAGLAAATEAVRQGFRVVVYEMDDVPGGFARSGRTATNMPTEYSWRGFGPWYHNTFHIMREIPCRTKDGSVFDKELSRQIYFAVVPDEYKGEKVERNVRSSLNFLDYLVLIRQSLRLLLADARSHEFYSRLNAAEYLKPMLSEPAWKAVVSAFGPWVGTDSQRTSLHHLGSFHRKNAFAGSPAPHVHPPDEFGGEWKHSPREGWLILKGPSSEAWFDPWVEHLRKLGVEFKFGHQLVSFTATSAMTPKNELSASYKEMDNNNEMTEITHATVRTRNGETITVEADRYISAVTPFSMAKVIADSSPSLARDPECGKFAKLVMDGPHIQISFRLGFGEKIHFLGKHQAMILRDSEFNITLFPDDAVFRKDLELGQNVVSLWTGTACASFVQGELTGRTMAQCTKEEFLREVLHQILRSKSLDELVKASNGGRSLATFPIVEREVWHSWEFPVESNGYVTVTAPQPKWVTSCNTHPYQPNALPPTIKNLLLAGSHCRTNADLWSMEGAVESGRRAGFLLAPPPKTKCKKKCCHRKTELAVIPQRAPLIIRAAWKVDNGLYRMGCPNIVDILILLLVIGVVLGIAVPLVWVYRD